MSLMVGNSRISRDNLEPCGTRKNAAGRMMLHSHGGNTGSNPVGDAKNFNKINPSGLTFPKNFPKTHSWTVPDDLVLYC
jgi:hypothetical protein